MTDKPTRQQIVDLLNADPMLCISVWAVDRIADILIRAGLAVEPREEGVYPCIAPSFLGTFNAFHVAYWDGKEWWGLEKGRKLPTEPNVIGSRILPPQE